MSKLLKDLYDRFYTPPELSAERQEAEKCHQALIKALEKPERRLVLRIIDAKDHIVENTSIDSFISGFRLAWKHPQSPKYNRHRKQNPQRILLRHRRLMLNLAARSMFPASAGWSVRAPVRSSMTSSCTRMVIRSA